MNRTPALLVCLLTAALLASCSSQPIQRKDGSSSARTFSMNTLAKGDIDTVVEIHQQEVIASLRTLTLKLYRRNPAEWRKSGFAIADEAATALFKPLEHWKLAPQKNLPW